MPQFVLILRPMERAAGEYIKTFVIVNPNSAGGATMKRWPRTSEKLERAIGPFEYEFTNAAGVASMLANSAVKKGFEKIIAVGGDGTLHEVIQGLFEKGNLINPDITIGTLPSGTGTDFTRTLKIPHDIDETIIRLRGKRNAKLDLGEVRFRGHGGADETRYFINVADVGLGGEVAERANNTPKVFGGFATYLFSSVISIASYKPKKVQIVADGQEMEELVTSVFIANGKYFGGGMHIAPNAIPDDGFFEVMILPALSKWDIIALAPKLYSGRILTMPGIKYFQAQHIEIRSEEDVLINLDGEQPGSTPVTFQLLPRIIKFKV